MSPGLFGSALSHPLALVSHEPCTLGLRHLCDCTPNSLVCMLLRDVLYLAVVIPFCMSHHSCPSTCPRVGP